MRIRSAVPVVLCCLVMAGPVLGQRRPRGADSFRNVGDWPRKGKPDRGRGC